MGLFEIKLCDEFKGKVTFNGLRDEATKKAVLALNEKKFQENLVAVIEESLAKKRRTGGFYGPSTVGVELSTYQSALDQVCGVLQEKYPELRALVTSKKDSIITVCTFKEPNFIQEFRARNASKY